MTPFWEMVIALSAIIGSIFIGLIAAVGIPVWRLTINSHTLILRDPTGDKDRIRKFLMKEKYDKKTGETTWQSRFWQKKYVCEKPPAKAIELDKRRKCVAEAIRIGDKEHIWLTSRKLKIKEKEISVAGGDTRKVKYVTGVDQEGNEIYTYLEPFTKTEKISLVNEYTKAELRNRNKWTPDKIASLVGFSILGFIVILFIVFGSDIYAARNDGLTIQQGNLKILSDISQQQAKTAEALMGVAKAMDLDIDWDAMPEKGQDLVLTDNEEMPDGKP